jgi:iron complex transport system substrate-binding protein
MNGSPYSVVRALWIAWVVVLSCATAQPPRVVSLAPNLTELIYALELEEHLVGRSSACDHPEATAHVPVVGGFGRPNPEALWMARPDIIYATDMEHPGLLQQWTGRGIAVRLLPCESWDQLKAAAQVIGEDLGAPDRARAWNDNLDARLHALRQYADGVWSGRTRPLVYVEVWGQPVMTVGGDTFLHHVVELAGGRNLGAELRGQYPAISAEWVIQQNPDVILFAYMLADMQAADRVRNRLGWSGLTAVRENRLIDTIHPDWLLRPGPRLIDGAEALARQLSGAASTPPPDGALPSVSDVAPVPTAP